MGSPVVHWELWSKDPAKCSEFYSKVFDWKVQHVPELSYWMADTGGVGGINGGFMKPQEGPWPGNMALYMAVDDLPSTLEKVKAAGGRVIVERQEIPGMGALALFADPEDRVLGLWVMAPPAGA